MPDDGWTKAPICGKNINRPLFVRLPAKLQSFTERIEGSAWKSTSKRLAPMGVLLFQKYFIYFPVTLSFATSKFRASALD
jgi:hypothetical protein